MDAVVRAIVLVTFDVVNPGCSACKVVVAVAFKVVWITLELVEEILWVTCAVDDAAVDELILVTFNVVDAAPAVPVWVLPRAVVDIVAAVLVAPVTVDLITEGAG